MPSNSLWAWSPPSVSSTQCIGLCWQLLSLFTKGSWCRRRQRAKSGSRAASSDLKYQGKRDLWARLHLQEQLPFPWHKWTKSICKVKKKIARSSLLNLCHLESPTSAAQTFYLLIQLSKWSWMSWQTSPGPLKNQKQVHCSLPFCSFLAASFAKLYHLHKHTSTSHILVYSFNFPGPVLLKLGLPRLLPRTKQPVAAQKLFLSHLIFSNLLSLGEKQ